MDQHGRCAFRRLTSRLRWCTSPLRVSRVSAPAPVGAMIPRARSGRLVERADSMGSSSDSGLFGRRSCDGPRLREPLSARRRRRGHQFWCATGWAAICDRLMRARAELSLPASAGFHTLAGRGGRSVREVVSLVVDGAPAMPTRPSCGPIAVIAVTPPSSAGRAGDGREEVCKSEARRRDACRRGRLRRTTQTAVSSRSAATATAAGSTDEILHLPASFQLVIENTHDVPGPDSRQ